MMRICTRCKEEKVHTLFYRDKNMKSGYEIYCKACRYQTRRASVKRRLYEQKYFRAKRQSPLVLLKEKAHYQTEQYKEIHKISSRNYVKKHPERQRARAMAQREIELGTVCERCGLTGTKLHRHHPDYSKPLEVIILCPPCHGLEHKLC